MNLCQRTDDRGQMTDDRGQMTDDRGQMTEDRGQMTDDRGQRAYLLNSEVGRRKSEKGTMTESWIQKREIFEFRLIAPN